jgi:hypothetical protein
MLDIPDTMRQSQLAEQTRATIVCFGVVWVRALRLKGPCRMGSLEYDVFISCARKDNVNGWVSGLIRAIDDDFREFSSQFKVLFDTKDIRSGGLQRDYALRPSTPASWTTLAVPS